MPILLIRKSTISPNDMFKRNPLIMIVDDSRMDTLLIKQVLKQVNQNDSILSFECPLHALAYIENCIERKELANLPDLIFLDINMPYVSGFQFLDSLSELEHQLNSKVVMVTSSDDIVDIERSVEYRNIIGYLIKPVRKEDLMHIESLLKKLILK